MEKDDQTLTKQAESVFADLLESMIVDVASEAHRAARLGLDPRLDIDEEEEYQLSVQARISVGDSSISGSKKSKHGVDIFGQTHPAVANEVFECMNCNRNIMAGRFAPHLEKCMGKGRRARSKTACSTKSDSQRNTLAVQKAATMITSSTPTKRLMSNSKDPQENWPDVNGRTFNDNGEDNDKVLLKKPKRMKKGASKRSSRSSVRQ
eukprot:c18061_g1_i1 orf=264-884(+)